MSGISTSAEQTFSGPSKARVASEFNNRKQLLYFVGYGFFCLAFLGWLSFALELPGRCWSLCVAPKEVSVHELETGRPFQVNLVVKDFQVVGEGTPVFDEDDPNVQIGTLFALMNARPQILKAGDAPTPTVFAYFRGDANERARLSNRLKTEPEFACVSEPATWNASLADELEKGYPGIAVENLLILSSDGLWKTTLTLLSCVVVFGLMLGAGTWQLWKKYNISEFFLEKEQSPNRHLSVTSWRNGAIIGVTAVKPDKFPSLPTKPQLSVAATYIFVILSCALWFCGAFGWMWVLTLNAPWWGKILMFFGCVAVYFGARQLMAWGALREPRSLDMPGVHSIASSIECESFKNDLVALGFVDDCPDRSIQRKFLSSASGQVVAMTGFSKRDKCFYVSFITYLDDGRVLQTSSKTNYLIARSRFEPLWVIQNCNEVKVDEILQRHIQLVKDETVTAGVLAVSADGIEDADNYLDQLSLRAWANMLRKSVWRI